ncbi:MAG TPA: response regulator transcription factor [Gemmatimonadaceae bacterium]|nr:response regulator transcription factor [Gemmatimonadaceae bacterium]
MSEQGAPEIIKVVMVEANEHDASEILGVLREAGMQISAERVQSEEGLAEALQKFKPDVVLSDYSLPEIDYRAAIKVVHELQPRTPVIVVAGLLRNEDSGSCVRAGADSFVSKLNLFVLPLAVRSGIEARAPLFKLTTRQMEVMRLVASGYRTREVAEALKLSEKTVETHRHQLMRKLGLESTAGLVRYAMRCGFAVISPLITVSQ